MAADNPSDAQRAAWQYRRAVVVEAGEALASLVLPPELSAKAGASGRDLRLVDGDGRETPFLLDWTSEREGLATWRAGVKDIRREKENARTGSAVRSQWTIDLGDERTFTDLSLAVPDVAFAWHVRVEASVFGKRYDVIETEASLFDQAWNSERVRKTDIRFDAPVTARYLRLTARSASGSPLLELAGASVTWRRRLKGDSWSMNVSAEPAEGILGLPANITRYRLSASSLLPFDELEVRTDDAAFARHARLFEQIETPGRQSERLLGEGRVFRLRASDSVVAGESTRIGARNGSGGALYLDINDAASPPLRRLSVRLHGSRVRLLFPVPDGALTLYYGNEATRAPFYDLESLRPQLIQALGTGTAILGAEEANPLFRREPPLRFAAVVGASLDPALWHHERSLMPIRDEDVYALVLKAEDLAVSRPDLADLRIVDDANRQVPFLIDPNFAEEKISLRVQKGVSSPSPRSRYELALPEPMPGNRSPQLSRMEIEVRDAFFERPARLRRARNEFQREAPFSLTLARRPPSSGPLRISTTLPLEPLTLEVDDGDNAPLDIRSAHAIIRVPRVVFKAAPGSLRLLLGNQGSEAPRYDLAGLRTELLAYSAVPAAAQELRQNQEARESLFSRFGTASPSGLVWGAIIAAIIVLLGLTLKTIKSA